MTVLSDFARSQYGTPFSLAARHGIGKLGGHEGYNDTLP